jgi:hypothetical protein
MENQIKVYGKEAMAIKPGDIFVPSFDSVEGHTVVTLVKNNTLEYLLERYDKSEIGLDQIIKEIRYLTKQEQIIQ